MPLRSIISHNFKSLLWPSLKSVSRVVWSWSNVRSIAVIFGMALNTISTPLETVSTYFWTKTCPITHSQKSIFLGQVEGSSRNYASEEYHFTEFQNFTLSELKIHFTCRMIMIVRAINCWHIVDDSKRNSTLPKIVFIHFRGHNMIHFLFTKRHFLKFLRVSRRVK